MSPHEFLDAKMQLASRYPFRETSGFRSVMDNAAVGGVHYSAHQFWLGTDIVPRPDVDWKELIEAGRRLGLFVLDEGDHLHLQPLDWKAG